MKTRPSVRSNRQSASIDASAAGQQVRDHRLVFKHGLAPQAILARLTAIVQRLGRQRSVAFLKGGTLTPPKVVALKSTLNARGELQLAGDTTVPVKFHITWETVKITWDTKVAGPISAHIEDLRKIFGRCVDVRAPAA